MEYIRSLSYLQLTLLKDLNDLVATFPKKDSSFYPQSLEIVPPDN